MRTAELIYTDNFEINFKRLEMNDKTTDTDIWNPNCLHINAVRDI